MARVQDALAQLPRGQREVLELGYFGGCTCADAAARLGVPLGTAQSRIRDALLRLRDLLGDHEAVGPCPWLRDSCSRWIAAVEDQHRACADGVGLVMSGPSELWSSPDRLRCAGSAVGEERGGPRTIRELVLSGHCRTRILVGRDNEQQVVEG